MPLLSNIPSAIIDEARAALIPARRWDLLIRRLRTSVSTIIAVGVISYVALLALDGLVQVAGTVPQQRYIQRLALGDGDADFWIMGFVAGGAAISAFRAAAHLAVAAYGPRIWLPWASIGAGCLAIGIVDGLNLRIGTVALIPIALPVLIGGTLSLAGSHRWRTETFWLLSIGLLLVLINPIITTMELHVYANPHNYVNGSMLEPLPLKRAASIQLWMLSRLQESSEIAAMSLFWAASWRVGTQHFRKDEPQ